MPHHPLDGSRGFMVHALGIDCRKKDRFVHLGCCLLLSPHELQVAKTARAVVQVAQSST